ncbi:MAG: tRNA (guanosine(46)-N7)-methyltransferase TrmB [Chlamydiae bacterium]|nr:tRNA (guanosine(46)-N7)-methyltransferase TrmB [Chlamydiota bacterium]MBI3277992.1 tRNA (guanosine(46)-N7)-methyltransferase TrmB [Chlamydiota bacterium]
MNYKNIKNQRSKIKIVVEINEKIMGSLTEHVLLDYTSIRNFKSWKELFKNPQPLKVDIGCGKDDALIERALHEPHFNFIGIENDSGIAYRFEKKIRRSKATNLLLVLFDAHFVIEKMFDNESVELFSMQFPDPWPKKRHHKRRVLTSPFVKILRDKLRENGEFFVATDVQAVSELALEVVNICGGFKRITQGELKSHPFHTLYEKKFLSHGLPIHYLKFKKID